MTVKTAQHVEVQPQIELAVETVRPPLGTAEGQFAVHIESVASRAGYTQTPDGWLVPLQDLRDRVRDLADFIYYETLHYEGELEIIGGFAIITEDGQTLGVSASSTFRFAAELARVIIALKPNDKEHLLFVDNQESWKLSCLDDTIEIERERTAKWRPEHLQLPAKELKEQMQGALAETRLFVAELEQFLLMHHSEHITSDRIRWIFSLGEA